MSETGAVAALSGGSALLERAVSYALGPLGLVTPAALDRPTPCRDWDLRALLVHMDDSLAALQEALELCLVDLSFDAEPGSAAGPAAGGELAADPAGVLRGRARRLLSALAGTHEVPVSIGGCLLPASIVTSAGAIDVAVHGWDVGWACGAAQPIPELLAEHMLTISPLLVTSADRPARFAPPVRVPAGATAGDRLLAYLGRHPG